MLIIIIKKILSTVYLDKKIKYQASSVGQIYGTSNYLYVVTVSTYKVDKSYFNIF